MSLPLGKSTQNLGSVGTAAKSEPQEGDQARLGWIKLAEKKRKQIMRCLGARSFWRFFKPHLEGPELKKELERRLGTILVRDFLAEHRLLTWLLSEERADQPYGTADHDGSVLEARRGGALEDKPSVEAFGYAKNWLRHEAPAFGVEDAELSINVAASLVVPLVLLPITCARIPTISLAMQLSSLVFALFGTIWCMHNFRANRGWERIGALDRMISVWEIRRNKAQSSERGPRVHGEGGD